MYKRIFNHQWLIFAAVWAIFHAPYGNSVDIAFHDTYFVVDTFGYTLFVLVATVVFWALHHFIKASRTIKIISHVHLLSGSLLFIIGLILQLCSPPVRRYYDYNVYQEFQSTSLDFLTVIYDLIPILLTLIVFIFPLQWILYFLTGQHKKSGN